MRRIAPCIYSLSLKLKLGCNFRGLRWPSAVVRRTRIIVTATAPQERAPTNATATMLLKSGTISISFLTFLAFLTGFLAFLRTLTFFDGFAFFVAFFAFFAAAF